MQKRVEWADCVDEVVIAASEDPVGCELFSEFAGYSCSKLSHRSMKTLDVIQPRLEDCLKQSVRSNTGE